MEPRATPMQPRSILLATDLGHRCDRALDRAVTCARTWQAKVLCAVVSEDGAVSEARRAEGERRLQEDIRAALQADDVVLHVRLEQGEPAEQVVAIAASEGSGVIVTGIARSSPLAGIFLGRTVDRLLRKATVPLLVVRRRGRLAYRQIVVGTDLSAPSRQALRTALAWFPDVPVLLFHAYRPPMSATVEVTEAGHADMHAAAMAECRAFLEDSGLSAAERDRITLRAEYGEPETLLARCHHRMGGDVLVLGSHGRNVVYEALIGSTVRRLLDEVDTDVLVVGRDGNNAS